MIVRTDALLADIENPLCTQEPHLVPWAAFTTGP